MNNPQDIAQLLAASGGGNSQLLGLGGGGMGLPNPSANGSATAGADALFQSLLQRHAVEKFAALNGLGNLPQGSLQMLLQQKQLQDLQTLTLARSMGMGMNMFNPMMGMGAAGGGNFDALAMLQQQQNQMQQLAGGGAGSNQDMNAAAAAQQDGMFPLPPDRRRKGRTGTFPAKLHQMLSDLERQEGGTLIASFLPHGRAFAIHKPRDFVKHVMPKYFRMSRFSSFQRQLNLYEFIRITEGADKGAYYHDLFIQGRPILSTMMKRIKIKGVKALQEAAPTQEMVAHVTSQVDAEAAEDKKEGGATEAQETAPEAAAPSDDKKTEAAADEPEEDDEEDHTDDDEEDEE